MKQKDIAVLALVIVVSGIISLFISKYIFDKPANRQQQVESVDVITAKFTQPSTAYFNSNSIDPTQTINVNSNSNNNIFGNSNSGQ